ncbi:hypothetical protein [Aurantiacibacter sp. MUD61]|uniref:hypothetical protein n=1 Tax=Aurantiacibacter sp. MUD61 TaxID=3009083 RepID=UPI0022EFF7CC|nr:hypothetical protein [Aurantiacibacter sp. MUD61]
MFRAFRSTRRKSSLYALALALSGGAAFGVTAVAPATAAAQEMPDPSSGFAAVYNEAIPLVQAETANWQAAQAILPRMTAAIENNRDRDLAGRYMIAVGSELSDRQLQRQGIELRLQGGLVAAEQLGVLNWYAGNFALEADDYEASRAFLNAALAAGYREEGVDIVNLIARTYMEQGDDLGSYNFLTGAIAEADAAGNAVPEAWLRNSLQYAYEEAMMPETLDIVVRLINDYPADRSWSDGLRIMEQTLTLSDDAAVDLYRLMAERGALVDRSTMVSYIEEIDPRLMSNEVLEILQLGMDSGVFTSSDPYYTEVQGIASGRASIDRNGIGGIVSEGRNGDALDAMNAGDVLYSLDDYAQAEQMYALGLERGFDANTANLRIGINQAMQGKHEEALTSFAAVTGERQPVAALWAAHVEAMHADMGAM